MLSHSASLELTGVRCRVLDVTATEVGSNRVNRGGSWNNSAQNARVANRNRNDPTNRNNNLGFRLSSTRHHPIVEFGLSPRGQGRRPAPGLVHPPMPALRHLRVVQPKTAPPFALRAGATSFFLTSTLATPHTSFRVAA